MLSSIFSILVITYLFAIGIIKDYIKGIGSNKGKTRLNKIKLPWMKSNYVKHVFGYVRPCFEREVISSPNDTIKLKIYSDIKPCINMGSYNYLAYGGTYKDNLLFNKGKKEELDITLEMSEYSKTISECTNRKNLKKESITLLELTEKKFSEFIGTESAIFLPMGWATNVTVIPLFADKNTLIMSDQLNHASIAMGCKLTGSKIISFKNNDPNDLEFKLLEEIEKCNKINKSYNKILIIVEGIYSMEGGILVLTQFIRIKNTYKAYLYVDEAHSIGAIGERGKGICEYSNVNPNNIDILMGTFTKSFSSIGGYIAGSNKLISYIKHNSISVISDVSLAENCVKQISNVLDDLVSIDQSTIGINSCNDDVINKYISPFNRIKNLSTNTKSMREKLIKYGLPLIGDDNSPVIPIMTGDMINMKRVSDECIKYGIAIVVAAYPATDIKSSRIRLCMSSAHTEEQIIYVAQILKGILCN